MKTFSGWYNTVPVFEVDFLPSNEEMEAMAKANEKAYRAMMDKEDDFCRCCGHPLASQQE